MDLQFSLLPNHNFCNKITRFAWEEKKEENYLNTPCFLHAKNIKKAFKIRVFDHLNTIFFKSLHPCHNIEKAFK